MNHIFISHCHEDSDFAEILESKLKEANFAVWRDTRIGGGKDWRKEIDQAINEALALIVTMTTEAKASQYVTYEWAFAWGAGVKVIPILLKKTELHPRLESLQYLDFTNRNARPWDTLIELLGKEKEMRVDGIPPIGRVHGYSGEWRINTEFSHWQNRPVVKPDRVVFQGKMFLLLSVDGERGSGTQTGESHVSIGNWNATYQVANQVIKANVSEDGTLYIDGQVLSRTRVKGDPPDAPYRDELFGKRQFQVELHPKPGSVKTLIGEHTYPVGTGDYQAGEEIYEYVGFFGTLSE